MRAARGGGGSSGGCGLWWLDGDGLVVVCSVVGDSGKGGCGWGLLGGLCLGCPWRWDGPHPIRVQGGGGGDGGSSG